MEVQNQSMLMDYKIYQPPLDLENGHQLEHEEVGDVITMVIETANYRIEIEIDR